jgi:hypothetical protein
MSPHEKRIQTHRFPFCTRPVTISKQNANIPPCNRNYCINYEAGDVEWFIDKYHHTFSSPVQSIVPVESKASDSTAPVVRPVPPWRKHLKMFENFKSLYNKQTDQWQNTLIHFPVEVLYT